MVSTEEKVLIGGGVAGVAALVALVALTRKAAATVTGAQITLSAPSSDTVGTPITVTATYTQNGKPMSGATLYLFYYYSASPVTASSIASTSFTLVSSATTSSSGQATWQFTPTEVGYYYLVASNNNPPS